MELSNNIFEIVKKLSETEFIILVGLIGLVIYKLGELYYKFQETKYLLLNKPIDKEEKLEKEEPDFDTMGRYMEIDNYLQQRLETVYTSFAFRKLLPILKEFSSISEGNRNKFKMEFLDYFEFLTTKKEKELYEYRYAEFNVFKLILLDFYNNKTTKLEFLTINKFDMDKNEFKDFELIKSLFDGITTADMKNVSDILDSFSEEKK